MARTILGLVAFVLCPAIATAGEEGWAVSASGTARGASAKGPLDGDRFSIEPGSLWKADRDHRSHWQVTFEKPRQIGAILQISGDDPLVLRGAPRNYAWQVSADGEIWQTIRETVTRDEKRLYRVHRFERPIEVHHLRLVINHSTGGAAALREVEFFTETDADIPFDDWILAVSSTEDEHTPQTAQPFVDLARQCKGWEQVPAQCVWHGDVDEAFVAAEPRPLCAFLSGSFLEWCQCRREPWRGVQAVLKSRRLPIWGACGGAQVLAILEETGVERPWDCPRCRDPHAPQLPIYSHIGHLAPAPCGDYKQNVAERGLYKMHVVARDPVFAGVPPIFEITESHVGQIDFVPPGWTRVVTKGPGALTENQCLRVDDAPIYAAQFHMETFARTRGVSTQIMGNFLAEAKAWGGYNPLARSLPAPEPMPAP